MATAEAGTKKAPPKAPQEPIDQMLAEIRKGDPKGLIVAELRFYPGIPLGNATDDLQIIVTNQFHKAHYQERYQLTQLWAVAWNQINRDGRYSRVFVTDRLGNLVGRGTPHLTWVQER
jgi:hypothetical protein